VKWGTGCVGISSASSDGSVSGTYRSVQCKRASANGNVDDRGAVVSCRWTLSNDEHSLCGMGSAGLLEMSCLWEGVESPGSWGTVVSR
jgi:hypothetical protein